MGRQPSTQSSSSSLESRRSLRFKQLDEEAGPSQRVGDLEGSIALEQARAEEATPEPASQLEVSAKVPIPASPDVEMEEDTATPKPRGRGRPLNISASQPVETASESRAGRRSSRLQSVDAEEVIIPASQQPTPKVRRASQLSQVSQARQSAPVPSGMDVLVEESLESAPVRSSQIDQLATSPLNSQTEPEVSVPAATTRRSTRASSRVSASPAPSAPTSPTARRGTRKATASIPPSSSTRPALRRGGSSQVSFQEEALESPLFMPQSQPLETQAYTLHAQTVSSSPPRDCPSPPPAASARGAGRSSRVRSWRKKTRRTSRWPRQLEGQWTGPLPLCLAGSLKLPLLRRMKETRGMMTRLTRMRRRTETKKKISQGLGGKEKGRVEPVNQLPTSNLGDRTLRLVPGPTQAVVPRSSASRVLSTRIDPFGTRRPARIVRPFSYGSTDGTAPVGCVGHRDIDGIRWQPSEPVPT